MGTGQMAPGWYVEPDHAKRLGVSLLELWWLLEHGGFSERYEWFCAAWALEAHCTAAKRKGR